MWYRLAQQVAMAKGVGGGITRRPAAPAPIPAVQVKPEPHAQMWNALANQTEQHAGNHQGQPGDTAVGAIANQGPSTQNAEMRRLLPHHSNPQNTTLEEQLESARQQNTNMEPQSMSQQNLGKGWMLIRGLPQYGSGKGWVGFQGERPATLTLV